MTKDYQEINKIVEEFESTWSNYIGDIEFSEAFAHLAQDPEVPLVLPEMAHWLRTTLTTYSNAREEEIIKTGEEESAELRSDQGWKYGNLYELLQEIKDYYDWLQTKNPNGTSDRRDPNTMVKEYVDGLLEQFAQQQVQEVVEKIKELVAYSSFNCDAGGRVSERQDDAETVCHEIIADIDKMFTPPPQETLSDNK